MRLPGNCVRVAGVAPLSGIEDVDAQAAQVACTFFGGWDAQQRAAAGVAARSLEVAEVEQLVLDRSAADRAAELVPLRERNQAAVGVRNRLATA